MTPAIRDQPARDRAWGRHYASHGLRPVTRSVTVPTPTQRMAAYAFKRAMADATTRATT